MQPIYLQTRAELTNQMKAQIKKGYVCYRVRTICNCKLQLKDTEMYPKSNQRNGVLVINNNTVVCMFVKCKQCNKAFEKQSKNE